MQAIQKYGSFSFPLFAQLKDLDVSGLAQKHVGDAKTHLGSRSFTFGACDYADFGHVMDTSFSKC
jgi:hypothetical protein